MKSKSLLILPLLALAFFFLPTNSASAYTCDQDTTVNVVARDPSGTYLPNVKAELYYQVTDANGNSRPGNRAAYANTSSDTGIAQMTFRNRDATSAMYALKLQAVNNDQASFWYYNVNLSCGETASVDKTLSGIYVILRDYSGSLLYNTNFSIYSQAQDSSGQPIRQTQTLIGNFNTGATGAYTVYVPQGSRRSVDGSQSDYYVLKFNNNSQDYYNYDIKVTDGSLSKVDYYVSAMKVTIYNASNGAAFPSGTNVEVYKQTVDTLNDKVKGEKVGSFKTDDNGVGIFQYPPGVYVLGIKGDNGAYTYYWDAEIMPGQLNEYEWQVGSSFQAGNETCSTNSQLSINILNLNGQPLSDFHYEFYQQETDVLGRAVIGQRISSGRTDSAGRAEVNFKPDPRKNYVLKVYEDNSDSGAYLFYNVVNFACGDDKTVVERLPYLKIVLRDADGSLKKNFSFSVYAEETDADGHPYKNNDKQVGSYRTGDDGAIVLYLAPASAYSTSNTGLYILSAKVNNSIFDAYDIQVKADNNSVFEYVFSNVHFSLSSADGKPEANKEIKLYQQKEGTSGYSLGNSLQSGRTDSSGNLKLEYPSGTYAALVKDSFNRDDIFWNIAIKSGQSNQAKLIQSQVLATVRDALGGVLGSGTEIRVYSLYESKGCYYQDQEVGSFKIGDQKVGSAVLAEGPYLIAYKDKNNNLYGQAIWAQHGKAKTLSIRADRSQMITSSQAFSLTKPQSSTPSNTPASSNNNTSESLAKRLSGYILLQVQDKGQAWYVSPQDEKRYYLANGGDAFQIMRQTGVGITNTDLAKIPIGVDPRLSGNDSDGDLLPDGLETAIGTNPNSSDSDGDGFLDGQEVESGYNPLGAGKLSYNLAFANKQKGKILLQVQSHGEAWYINPKDGKRYYLGNGDMAFQIMRYLSLGISNSNLETIKSGD